jgi:hypothetical protein
MNLRPVIVSVILVSAFAAILVWLYCAEQISIVAIGLIVITGLVFVALTHFLYKQMWQDDED